MMLALLAVLASGPPAPPDWAATAERLKSSAEAYSRWGITFSLDAHSEFTAAGAPVPEHIDLMGSLRTPDEVTISIRTTVGAKHALAVHLTTCFKLDGTGKAKEGDGALYVDGRGQVGKFKFDPLTGVVFDPGVEETFFQLGIKLGEGDEGPTTLGLKLGPLSLGIDPAMWARQYRQSEPTFTRNGAGKIAGAEMSLDADALLAAVSEAPGPPQQFTDSRLAVSLKGAIEAGAKDFGNLNSIDGVLIDLPHNDLVLIGVHESRLASIPMEYVTAVARSVYVQGQSPWVCLEPVAGNLAAPNRARIGGFGSDLEKSAIVEAMLTADYSMKQLVMGKRKIEGVPEMMDLTGDADPIRPEQWRCWITPNEPLPGNVRLSAGPVGRYYHFLVQPLVRAETKRFVNCVMSGFEIPVSAGPNDEPLADNPARCRRIAQKYSQNYAAIESNWPESSFGRARQILQLSGLFSLLKSSEKEAWETALVRRVAALPAARREIRASFPGLTSTPVPFQEATITIDGGLSTAVNLPAPVPGTEQISHESIRWSAWRGTLPAPTPAADEVAPVSIAAGADAALLDASEALESDELGAAAASASVALSLRPKWDQAESILIEALAALNRDEAGKELGSALAANPDSWRLLNLSMSMEAARADWAGVRKTATKLIGIQPKAAQSYAERAHAMYMEQAPECRQEWDTALKLAPECGDLRLGRAAVWLWQKQELQALLDIDAAIKLAPLNGRSQLLKGELLLNMGRTEEAISALKMAVTLAPEHWMANDILARALFINGDYDGTIESMTSAYLARPRIRAASSDPAAGDDSAKVGLFRLPSDPLEQFIDAPDEPHRRINKELIEFDPMIWLLRGASQFHLEHYAEARKDLSRYYGLDQVFKNQTEKRLKPGLIGDVRDMLDTCEAKLQ